MKQSELDIIVIDDTLEALALRSALEWWGVRVALHLIGKSQDIVDLFKNGTLSSYICIAAHGDEIDSQWGIKLPELGIEIAKKQPYDKILFPQNLSEFVKLHGQHILSLACGTGNKDIATAFLDAGANSYIGPDKAPFGNASLYFALNFYYWHLAKEKSVKESYQKAISMVNEDIDMFSIFEK